MSPTLVIRPFQTPARGVAQVPGSIFDWNGKIPVQEFPKNGDYTTTQSQNGAYVATRLKPTDNLSVILGTRVSDGDLSFTATRRGTARIARIWARVAGPLGLAWRQRSAAQPPPPLRGKPFRRR